MAVQGPERKYNICDRCFASVPVNQPYCPECGAQIVIEERAEGSDSIVYTELARANLLRMRGEYRQAEEQCLNILKRFPNNASANTLLGDISAEQADLQQAVQWYELALDLVPGDSAVKNKLDSVRSRIQVNETAETAKQLGLPSDRKYKTRYILSVLIPVVFVAFAAYIYGAKHPDSGLAANPIVSRVFAPPQDPAKDPAPQNPSSYSDPETALANGGEVRLAHKLATVTGEATKAIAILHDPRSHALTLVYSAGEGDYRSLGARLGRSLLEVEQDALTVNVRAMKSGALVYTADILRSRVNESNGASWQQDNPGPGAWIDYVLTNEWTATPKKESEPSESASNPAPNATTPSSKQDDSTASDQDQEEYKATRTPIQPSESDTSSSTKTGESSSKS